MSIISLARRRIAQLVTSIPDDIDLLWSNSQSDETNFLTQTRTEKPLVAILTSEYADQPHLFANVRQTSPGTRIILCVLPDPPKPTLLWPLIDALDLDVLCSLSELNDCLRTVVKGHLYVSTLLATHSATLKKVSFPG